jgi:hypothetical protein
VFIRTFLCCGHFLCLLCVFCFAIFCICSSGEDFIYPSLGCSVVYVWGLFSIIFPFTVTFSLPYNFNFRCPYFVSYISYHGYFSLSCHACILFCSIDPWILQNVCYSFHFIRLLTSWELQNLINNYHLNNKNNVWSLGPFGRLGISPSFSNIYPQRACTHFAIASNAHARIFLFAPAEIASFSGSLVSQLAHYAGGAQTTVFSYVWLASQIACELSVCCWHTSFVTLRLTEILRLIIRPSLNDCRYLSFPRKGIWSFVSPVNDRHKIQVYAGRF